MTMESDYEDRISEVDSDFGSDAENRVPAKKQKATISSFAKVRSYLLIAMLPTFPVRQ